MKDVRQRDNDSNAPKGVPPPEGSSQGQGYSRSSSSGRMPATVSKHLSNMEGGGGDKNNVKPKGVPPPPPPSSKPPSQSGIFSQKNRDRDGQSIPGLDLPPEKEEEEFITKDSNKVDKKYLSSRESAKSQDIDMAVKNESAIGQSSLVPGHSSSSAVSSSTADANSAPVNPQNQLAQLVQMLQQGMTVDQVAESMNMKLDEQTIQLMNNLSSQLMVAASLNKRIDSNLVDLMLSEKSDSGSKTATSSEVVDSSFPSGSERSDYQNQPMPAAHGSSIRDPADDFSSSSNQSFSNDGLSNVPGDQTGYQFGNGASQNVGGSSGTGSNAGVKAALAQLLAQQGVRVAMGGSEVPTESDSTYEEEKYSGNSGNYYPRGESKDTFPSARYMTQSSSSSMSASSSAGPRPLMDIRTEATAPSLSRSSSLQKQHSYGSSEGEDGFGGGSGSYYGQYGNSRSSSQSSGPKPLLQTPSSYSSGDRGGAGGSQKGILKNRGILKGANQSGSSGPSSGDGHYTGHGGWS